MSVIELNGSPKMMGEQMGTLCRLQINAYVRKMYKLVEQEARSKGMATMCDSIQTAVYQLYESAQTYGGHAYEEVCGVSATSGVAVQDLLFALAYSDVIDILFAQNVVAKKGFSSEGGCTAVVATCEDNASINTVAGQTWDMPALLAEDVVVLNRCYDNGKHLLSLTTILGQTHIGMNGSGLCIGTNNLSTTETGKGLCFAMLIHLALMECTSVIEAVTYMTKMPRLSGHNYYLADRYGVAANLEVTARRCKAEFLENRTYVHANHYRETCLRSTAIDYSDTSHQRQDGLETLLNDAPHPLNPRIVSELLCNHSSGICRHGGSPEAITTVAAVVFQPFQNEMRYVVGSPCERDWETIAT